MGFPPNSDWVGSDDEYATCLRTRSAAVLYLVQPLAAGQQLIGFGWETRRDEPGREGTLQHVEQIKSCDGSCNFTIKSPHYFA